MPNQCSTLRCIAAFATFVCSAARADDAASLRQADALLARMTVEDKLRLVHGSGDFAWGELPRLGIPKVGMNDGPQGVRGPAATAFPCGLAMAATWDPALIQDAGRVLGLETLANGNRVHLGPAVNLMRTPLGGRTFEYMGEDPVLAGLTAAGYINGLQSTGAAACLKHFTGNEQEVDRFDVSVELGERTLRELYAKVFQVTLEHSHPWSMMGSYNRLRGRFALENRHLMTDILRTDWKYDGCLMSDWGAWHDTARSLAAGSDLAMPLRRSKEQAAREVDQAKQGVIDPARLDDAVRHNLLLMFRTGGTTPAAGEATNAEHQAVARRVADGAITLLKNDGGLLPLKADALNSVAVIGPAADWQPDGIGPEADGGSGRVHPPHDVTTLDGLRAALPASVKVSYAAGYRFARDLPPPIPADAFRTGGGSDERGLKAEFFDGDKPHGRPVATTTVAGVRADFADKTFGGGQEHFSVRWTGQIVPPVTGTYAIALTCDDGGRVTLDGKPLIDDWSEHQARTTTKAVDLVAGHRYDLAVEYFNAGGDAVCALGWTPPGDAAATIDTAVDAAKAADVAVVCVGITHGYDHEGGDKPTLALMGPAAELVGRVREANPKTVVVLTGGSPMDLEAFADRVPAVVWQYYPGMEGGHALADVLTGKVNPSGKLPVTLGKTLADYAPHTPGHVTYPDVQHVLGYDEGVFMGYRHFDRSGIEPRYCFGYGLSYTTFAYDAIHATPAGDGWDVAFTLTNTGPVAGAEVAQLYVGQPNSPIERAPRELKAFEKMSLRPGERKAVTLHVSRQDLAYWNEAKPGGWDVLPGAYTIEVGGSSRALPLRTTVTAE